MDTLLWVLIVVIVVLVAVVVFMLNKMRTPGSLIQDSIRSELQSLAQATLSQSSEQLLTLANEKLGRETESNKSELETKKKLIDEQLSLMRVQLGEVQDLVKRYEKDRASQFGIISTELKTMGVQTQNLTDATSTLREALSSSQMRGQWGERMAEDVLRLVGFVEGVNYQKQQQIEGTQQRPDFVFMLPNKLTLNMDVKFPLDNYLRYLEDEDDNQKSKYRDSFLSDVKGHIDAVVNRDYIDPEGGTLDYVLLFIPNESIYSFIHLSDNTIMDRALSKKVVFCSPLTLFAILCVVRQAVDNFSLRRDEDNIISLMGRFNTEWSKFTESLEKFGKRINVVQGAYDELNGTRRRAMQRSLDRIRDLQLNRGLPDASQEALTSPEQQDGLVNDSVQQP